ncbi:hypothetical protein U1Q18_041516, partial [Sarracenia purpurea var. burkii]
DVSLHSSLRLAFEPTINNSRVVLVITSAHGRWLGLYQDPPLTFPMLRRFHRGGDQPWTMPLKMGDSQSDFDFYSGLSLEWSGGSALCDVVAFIGFSSALYVPSVPLSKSVEAFLLNHTEQPLLCQMKIDLGLDLVIKLCRAPSTRRIVLLSILRQTDC